MTKAQAEGLGGSEEMKASAAAMDKIPAIILVPMVNSYLKGAMPLPWRWPRAAAGRSRQAIQ